MWVIISITSWPFKFLPITIPYSTYYLDTKDKVATKLFKKLKTQLGSPKSDKYKEWLNENIEKIYNLLPQSVFNKSYEQYTIKGLQDSLRELQYNIDVKLERIDDILVVHSNQSDNQKKNFQDLRGEY